MNLQHMHFTYRKFSRNPLINFVGVVYLYCTVQCIPILPRGRATEVEGCFSYPEQAQYNKIFMSDSLKVDSSSFI